MIEAHREVFKEEAYELLGELEASLIELEEIPDDKDAIGRVFRALHTIKGSGAMFGFDDLVAFTHEVEAVFDLVRNERLPVSKTLVDLTLSAGDQIRSMLSGAAKSEEGKAIIKSLKELLSRPETVVRQSESNCAPPEPSTDEEINYRISFRPHKGLFKKGMNPVLLLNELRGLGECKVISQTEAVPELHELDPEECFIYWDAILTTNKGINAIRDVFIFVEDDCELAIEAIASNDDELNQKLGEILIERGYVSQEDFREVLQGQKRIGEMLVDAGLVMPSKVESALAEQKHFREVREKRQKEETASSVKVPAERLDTLVDLVGELVTVQARLSQTAASQNDPELLSIAEEVERLTAELRDNTMSIRMMPIGTTFNKFKRLVRDLSNELGKEVVMITEGAETELDKTVIERLNDPLVHLIRNSIDHGIETPKAREEANKPRQGTVQLRAMHSGANVVIEIKDDGAGLDAQVIREKAIERGLISEGAELSEKDAYSLILAPGFSTARTITNVSGRGVGMDVVKQSIEALRGSIDISSQKGIGTTITLKLPLTLAIIDGLLVKIGDGHFVLPLSIVEECVELTREDAARAHGSHTTYVRGEIVPYIRLREIFLINGQVPEVEQIVITESPNGKVGFVVDKVVGEHQTVIKSMGRMYNKVDVISGATILGDGTVALIMDVPKLVKSAESREATRH